MVAIYTTSSIHTVAPTPGYSRFLHLGEVLAGGLGFLCFRVGELGDGESGGGAHHAGGDQMVGRHLAARCEVNIMVYTKLVYRKSI